MARLSLYRSNGQVSYEYTKGKNQAISESVQDSSKDAHFLALLAWKHLTATEFPAFVTYADVLSLKPFVKLSETSRKTIMNQLADLIRDLDIENRDAKTNGRWAFPPNLELSCEPQDLIKIYELIEAPLPEMPRVHLAVARALIESGKPSQALVLLEQESSALALLVWSQALFALGRIDEAKKLPDLQSNDFLDQEKFELKLQIARIAWVEKKSELATAQAQELIAQADSRTKAHAKMLLGLIYLEQQDFDQAIMLFEAALNQFAKLFWWDGMQKAMFNLAQALFERWQVQENVVDLQKAHDWLKLYWVQIQDVIYDLQGTVLAERITRALKIESFSKLEPQILIAQQQGRISDEIALRLERLRTAFSSEDITNAKLEQLALVNILDFASSAVQQADALLAQQADAVLEQS
jgi:tetratricopeptide (TPR) repeat protein